MSMSFIFYETFAKQLKCLDAETRCKFYDAIIEYGLYEIETAFTGIELSVWIPIKESIDNAKARREKSIDDGKRGGRPEIPQEVQNSICEDLKNGLTQKEIAEKHGVSQQVISKIKKGVYGTTHHKPSSNTTNLDVDVDVDVDVDDNGDGNDIPPEVSGGDAPPAPVQKTQTIQERAKRLALLLYDLHRQIDTHFTTSQKHIEQWAKDIEKLNRIDKRSYEDIEKVIRWIKTAGNFWCPNIISGSKLREKYPQVFLQMQQQHTRDPPEGKNKRFDCNVTGAQEDMPF